MAEREMEVLHICPANFATGGAESIHQLVQELNRNDNIYAKILYVHWDGKQCPQPKEYEHYGCPYITEFPEGFKGCVIFPEVYGNEAIEEKYKDCVVAMNWAGVDVYDWNVPEDKRGVYLQRPDMIHIARSEYAVDYLTKKGLKNIKVECTVADEFFNPYVEVVRHDMVLYNAVVFKMTQFQKDVMQRCEEKYHIVFQPIIGLTRREVMQLMYTNKLYIDFGEFSGRERLPREACLCGCCVITSRTGAAGYFADVAVPDEYKFTENQVEQAVDKIQYVLTNYKKCRPDFDVYRQSLEHDKQVYSEQVKELCDEILSHSTNI